MDGYLVQQPFADLIASGRKTWDVRVRPVVLPRKTFYILATRYPHRIASDYSEDRLGVAVATAHSVGQVGPISVEEMIKHGDKHQIAPDVLRAYAKGRQLYAMLLEVEPMEPRRYKGKQGAVHLIVGVEFQD